MRSIILMLMTALTLASCRFDKDMDKLDITTPAMALPVITSRLSVQDIMDRFEHDSLVSTGADGFITLVYTGNIYSTQGIDLLVIPDPQLTITSVDLPEVPFSISLGEMASNLTPPLDAQIFALHGQSGVPFPAIPTQPGGTHQIGSSNTTAVTFESGSLDLTITNNWPMDLTNIQISIFDSVAMTTVANFNFANIPRGISATRSANVAGKSISGNMSLDIGSIGGSAMLSTSVDTSDVLDITLEGTDLIFPILTDTATMAFTNGERIDHITLKEGTIDYTGTGSGGFSAASLVLDFPSLTSVAPAAIPIIGTTNIDLAGWEFDLTTGSPGKNALPVTLKFDGTGTSIPLGSPQSVTPTLDITGLKISYADGYIGQHNFNLAGDSIAISVYKNWFSGTVEFTDPSVDVIIRNSFGFPINAVFTEFNAFSQQQDSMVAVTTPFDSIDFNAPTIAGDFALTTIPIDNSNSNIVDVMKMPPTKVNYSLDVASNKAMDTAAFNFVTDSSFFRVDVDVQLPLEAKVGQLMIQDTMEVKLGFLESAAYANFAIATVNNFPLDLSLQVYFIDGGGNLIDSLLVPRRQLLQSGAVDANGRVISPRSSVNYASMDESRIDNIQGARKAIISGSFSSTNGGAIPVKIFDDSYFDVKVGVETTIKSDDL